MSVNTPLWDGHYLDSAGRQHNVGDGRMTMITALTGDGSEIAMVDPWLPTVDGEVSERISVSAPVPRTRLLQAGGWSGGKPGIWSLRVDAAVFEVAIGELYIPHLDPRSDVIDAVFRGARRVSIGLKGRFHRQPLNKMAGWYPLC